MHYMVSGVKSLTKADYSMTHNVGWKIVRLSKIKKQGSLTKPDCKSKHTKAWSNKEAKKANKQTSSIEYIAQAVAEAARVTIQTMSMQLVPGRTENEVIKNEWTHHETANIFDWSMKDKYHWTKKLQTRGKTMLQNFNISQAEL